MTATAVPTVPLPAVDDASVVIDRPMMFRPYRTAPDVDVLPAHLAVPGMGVLPANAFVVRSEEPMLVDAGPGGLPPGAFEEALRSVIDPTDLRWMWLTHTDPDHVGALAWLLAAAPEMRVITTYLAAGKLALHRPVPLDRCYFANPGDVVHIGDRKLLAVAPPSFDAPETVMLYDTRSATLFSADTFGALIDGPAAGAVDIEPAALEDGLVLWSTIDAPWLHQVDLSRFGERLAAVRRLAPRRILSAHLPPATAMTERLLELLARVPGATPWVGPDQQVLEAMLRAPAG